VGRFQILTRDLQNINVSGPATAVGDTIFIYATFFCAKRI